MLLFARKCMQRNAAETGDARLAASTDVTDHVDRCAQHELTDRGDAGSHNRCSSYTVAAIPADAFSCRPRMVHIDPRRSIGMPERTMLNCAAVSAIAAAAADDTRTTSRSRP